MQLEESFRMVVILSDFDYYLDSSSSLAWKSGSGGKSGGEFDQAGQIESNPVFDRIDWIKVTQWGWLYVESIELDESFPKRHSSSSSDGEEGRYGWITELWIMYWRVCGSVGCWLGDQHHAGWRQYAEILSKWIMTEQQYHNNQLANEVVTSRRRSCRPALEFVMCCITKWSASNKCYCYHNYIIAAKRIVKVSIDYWFFGSSGVGMYFTVTMHADYLFDTTHAYFFAAPSICRSWILKQLSKSLFQRICSASSNTLRTTQLLPLPLLCYIIVNIV